ncbi:MAG: MaoC family dehydratase N-terminal domain-containing protein [Betaproteobacteria bacterium]|nr:MaoC family dehydratase N-terminal domain-containing protein [Betaproteobacteria bacterium]
MTIDCNKLKSWPFGAVEQTYTDKDTMLYALSVGLGADPLDENQLKFVYEKNLQVLPTMANVLAYPGNWMRDPAAGIDWLRVVHGEHTMRLHKPLPAAGTIIGRTRITGVVDKGVGKGALLLRQREIFDQANGALLATLEQVSFCRGDGGYSANGGADGKQISDPPPPAPHELPKTDPQIVCDLPTLPQMALIYRLCADRHLLHADPAVARAAGFPRPILHGLGTLGVAGHALLKCCCGYDPAKLRSLRLRFSAPVYPGETIRMEMWKNGAVVSFRARVVERDIIVLNNGYAEIG